VAHVEIEDVHGILTPRDPTIALKDPTAAPDPQLLLDREWDLFSLVVFLFIRTEGSLVNRHQSCDGLVLLSIKFS
jgi:hypothetical protein